MIKSSSNHQHHSDPRRADRERRLVRLNLLHYSKPSWGQKVKLLQIIFPYTLISMLYLYSNDICNFLSRYKAPAITSQVNPGDDMTPDYTNILGMIFSMCGLMMRVSILSQHYFIFSFMGKPQKLEPEGYQWVVSQLQYCSYFSAKVVCMGGTLLLLY